MASPSRLCNTAPHAVDNYIHLHVGSNEVNRAAWLFPLSNETSFSLKNLTPTPDILSNRTNDFPPHNQDLQCSQVERISPEEAPTTLPIR